jgi:gas vesicle protein
MVASDPEYKKFVRILKLTDEKVSFDNMVKELENMHASRIVRQLHLKTPGVNTLIKTSMQEASYRSRCAEIWLIVNKMKRLLDTATETIHDYIMANYANSLGVKTKGERVTMVNAILKRAYTRLNELEQIAEHAETVMKDIDQAAWNLSKALQGLELIYNRDRVLKTK